MLVPHDVALGVEEGLEALVPLGVILVVEDDDAYALGFAFLVALHCIGVEGDDDALDMEDYHPHVALGVEEVHDQLALVELEVEVELDVLVEELVEELVEPDVLVEELVELDVAHAVGSSSLGFLLEELPLDCAVRDCGWR